jgi:hypothetical protein
LSKLSEALLNLSSILQWIIGLQSIDLEFWLSSNTAHGIGARNSPADGVFLCTRLLNVLDYSVR